MTSAPVNVRIAVTGAEEAVRLIDEARERVIALAAELGIELPDEPWEETA